MILVMYVDNNSIRHNCEELVQEFEKFVKMDGRINLQREGELDWFLSVRYSYCKLTGAISCCQEAYIHRLLVKYGMEHTNPCKLPMHRGTSLHCYQYRATAQLFYELSYSLHVKSHARSSHLCQGCAALSHWN